MNDLPSASFNNISLIHISFYDILREENVRKAYDGNVVYRDLSLALYRGDKVALVTLNRPDKRNALSIALRYEIDRCLAELEALVRAGVVDPSYLDPAASLDKDDLITEGLATAADLFAAGLVDASELTVTSVGLDELQRGGALDLNVLVDPDLLGTRTCWSGRSSWCARSLAVTWIPIVRS
jgi:hypothetical protein